MFNKLSELPQKNITTKTVDKFLPIVAVGFPGGYKFFIVFIVTTFASTTIATDFSIIFFWVALLVTFTGLPIASMMIAPHINISTRHKLVLILTSSTIIYMIAYIIELKQYSNSNNLFIYTSVLCLSSYEILKRYFLNEADFKSIFISSCCTMVLVISLLSSVFLLEEINVGIILLVCFFSLMFPILLLRINQVQSQSLTLSKFSDVLLGFIKYSLSNAASTSLLFVLPIILISDMGDVIATDLAKVFYFTSLTYLIPHALSAKHIPNMRKNGIRFDDVKVFFTTILIFVIGSIIISLPLIRYFYQQWEVYFMLFIAMQISQLSLPFSNILMVKGLSDIILKINILASAVFIILVSIIFTQIEVGSTRAKIFLLSFIGFQLLKLLLNYFHSKAYIQSTN